MIMMLKKLIGIITLNVAWYIISANIFFYLLRKSFSEMKLSELWSVQFIYTHSHTHTFTHTHMYKIYIYIYIYIYPLSLSLSLSLSLYIYIYIYMTDLEKFNDRVNGAWWLFLTYARIRPRSSSDGRIDEKLTITKRRWLSILAFLRSTYALISILSIHKYSKLLYHIYIYIYICVCVCVCVCVYVWRERKSAHFIYKPSYEWLCSIVNIRSTHLNWLY